MARERVEIKEAGSDGGAMRGSLLFCGARALTLVDEAVGQELDRLAVQQAAPPLALVEAT
jgi:hypothetical protein